MRFDSFMPKRYSVTYGAKENGQRYISFCEFYQPDTEFQSANDFMKHTKIGEVLLADLWGKAEDITIF